MRKLNKRRLNEDANVLVQSLSTSELKKSADKIAVHSIHDLAYAAVRELVYEEGIANTKEDIDRAYEVAYDCLLEQYKQLAFIIEDCLDCVQKDYAAYAPWDEDKPNRLKPDNLPNAARKSSKLLFNTSPVKDPALLRRK